MPGCHVQPEQMFNLIFGYNDRYSETGSDLGPAAGPYDAVLGDVDPNEVWVINTIWGLNNTRGCVIRLRFKMGADDHIVAAITTTAAGQTATWNGAVVMEEGDFVHVTFVNSLLNDDLYWGALGYKMVLTQ